MNEAPVSSGPRKTLPLEGIRVVDVTRFLPGPFCTMFLSVAESGA